MKPFFIVGPTAIGKSEIAAEIANQLNAEVVSADAFQVYRGLDRLTAKPEKATLAKVTHHLIDAVSLTEEMNAEKFRTSALRIMREIHERGKNVIVTGGSGLYVRVLTHGLSRFPGADPGLRAQMSELALDELVEQLFRLDPGAARIIDLNNRRRVMRAVEICLLTGKPVSEQRVIQAESKNASCGSQGSTKEQRNDGVFVFRDRADLYQRIDSRVKEMFSGGVIEEVRASGAISSTAEKAIGLREIRVLLSGEISEQDCISRIQRATRHYAKRQLTWFQRQPNFHALNLSSHGYPEAIGLIVQSAMLTFAQKDD